MAATCRIGASAWDVLPWIRAKIEDNTAPFAVPDASLLAYVETANEEFSRYLPLDEQIGNPYLTTASPLQTVVNQTRYVCNSTNGFAVAPTRITAVLWRASSAVSNNSEVSYLQFSPATPLNAFFFNSDWLDNPSWRVIRSEYLTELERFGKGTYGVVRDRTTGLLAIDLYPVPTQVSSVYVRYQAMHPATGTSTDPIYVTVPDDMKQHWANLLYAEVLEQESDRLAKVHRGQAGFLQMEGDAQMMRKLGSDLRERVFIELGSCAGVALTSS